MSTVCIMCLRHIRITYSYIIPGSWSIIGHGVYKDTHTWAEEQDESSKGYTGILIIRRVDNK